jgi:cellulose biosynthesis protein BcsQ
LEDSSGDKIFFDLINENKTIMGYFIDRVKSPYGKSGTETKYLIKPDQYNSHIPNNLYLVSGDTSLDTISPYIDSLSSVGTVRDMNAWRAIYSWLIDLQSGISLHLGSDNTVFFIDTNPSFSNYTKLALLAADRLIVPCFSDLGSLYALNSLMYLLYDITNNNLTIPSDTITKLSEKHELQVPLIHMMIIGKSTRWAKESALAFANIENDIKNKILNLQQTYNGTVFKRSGADVIELLQDLHSIAPYINITGRMLSQLKPGTMHTGVFFDGRELQIGSHIDTYQERVREIVAKL